MAIQRKSAKPVGITNEQGEPEIVLSIGGKVISTTPPKRVEPAPADEDVETDAD